MNYLKCPQSYKNLQLTEKSTKNLLLTFLRLKTNTTEHGRITLPKILSPLTLKIKFLFESCFPQEKVLRENPDCPKTSFQHIQHLRRQKPGEQALGSTGRHCELKSVSQPPRNKRQQESKIATRNESPLVFRYYF